MEHSESSGTKDQLYWIDPIKKKKDTHVDHSQLDPLPFKIIDTNILYWL